MRAEWAAPLATMFPETRRRYARCLKKLGYPSQADAEAVRARRQPQTDEVLRVYECSDCGLWHLTSKPMTDAQVAAEEEALLAEIARFNRLCHAFDAKARPFAKGHALWRLTPGQVDQAFAEQWALQQRGEDLAMAILQRTLLLARAQAPDGHTAAQLDREAARGLEARARVVARVQETMRQAHREYREARVATINQAFPLGAYRLGRPA